MQAFHAVDDDFIRTGALDISTHLIEEVCQIYDVRLLCHVFHDGLSLCKDSCQHDVHGRANRDNIEINMAADQTLRRNGRDKAFRLHANIAVQTLKALDVLIDRTNAAEIASAWHRHAGMSISAQLRTDEVVRCAQTRHELECLRTFQIHGALFGLNGCFIQTGDFHAHLFENLELQHDIDNIWNIFNNTRPINHQRCWDDSNSSIFCAADRHFAVQRMSALDDIFLQRNLLLKILTARIVVSPVNLYLPFTHVRIPRIPVSAHVYE